MTATHDRILEAAAQLTETQTELELPVVTLVRHYRSQPTTTAPRVYAFTTDGEHSWLMTQQQAHTYLTGQLLTTLRVAMAERNAFANIVKAGV